MHALFLLIAVITVAFVYVNYTAENLLNDKKVGINVRELTTKNISSFKNKPCIGIDNLGGYDMPTDANAY